MPVGNFDRPGFEEAILQNLERGVAYVLYEKFLKDRLARMHHHLTATMKKNRLLRLLRCREGWYPLIGWHSRSTCRLIFEDKNAVVDRARVFQREFL